MNREPTPAYEPWTPSGREAQALREVGRTTVSRRLAGLLVGVFLLTVGGVTVVEQVEIGRSGGGLWPDLGGLGGRFERALLDAGPLAANRVLLAAIDAFEGRLDERSILVQRVVPYAQWAETAVLGAGNRRAWTGRDGWLFYRPDVTYVTGPGFTTPAALAARREAEPSWRAPVRPDPRPAILDLARRLRSRGITLVVMPTPVKPVVHPGRFARRAEGLTPPVQNPSFAGFVRDLTAGGVEVFDPAPLLARAARTTGEPQFLAGDTHWTPAAMERVAHGLGDLLGGLLGPPSEPVAYQRRRARVAGEGDLVRMLRLPAGAGVFTPQEVEISPVLDPAGAPWRPDPRAEVLLLGDSFTNVYSQAELGWGQGAGLAEQLSVELQRPVDRIAVNAGGARVGRERLARLLTAGGDRVRAKRVVVYQLAVRELAAGDWRPAPSPAPEEAAAPGAEAERALLGDGFVVWESNRGGDWRIWQVRLDGTGLRRLSPDEPGRQHCCPHLSPDGKRMVYLSRSGSRTEYPEGPAPGALRLVHLDDRSEETLVEAARTYGWGDRAAVWKSDDELIYIDGDGRTVLLDLETGVSRPLTAEPRGELAWLIDPTLRHATTGAPSFSLYDAAHRRVLERRELGGCEPYFSQDGRWGVYIAGAGGPIDKMDLASRETSILLRKNDPRLSTKGYLYFPMLSRDGGALAFGASAGEHNHFTADYDVFVVPTDPETLEILGPPVRITRNPATDRYPDVHLASPRPRRPRGEAPSPVRAAPAPSGEPQLWPAARDSLVFLWQTGDSPNLVFDPAIGAERSVNLKAQGRAHLDHDYAMALAGGAYVAPPDAAERLLAAVKATNELTIEARVTPAESAPDGFRPIVTFSSGPAKRNFTLAQEGRNLVVRLRTGKTGANADRPQVALFPVRPGEPVHVVVTYSPGRLVAYRDGERVVASDAIQGSFDMHWSFRRLLFGREWGGGGDWAGALEGVALYDRALAPEVVRESARRYQRLVASRPRVPRWALRARLVAKSTIPGLKEISPYRRALAVYDYRVVEGPPELAAGTRLRVARWVILDGETLAAAREAVGRVRRLELESFEANPQLDGVYLSDTLGPAPQGPLYYGVEP